MLVAVFISETRTINEANQPCFDWNDDNSSTFIRFFRLRFLLDVHSIRFYVLSQCRDIDALLSANTNTREINGRIELIEAREVISFESMKKKQRDAPVVTKTDKTELFDVILIRRVLFV